ncbi:MAG: Zn-dependent alcohol dehydrogenase [Gammaproteobacteria bacterium]|nr:Zn-dependent alcohol dehydrogenase [Gammaproteobacteria bacterium]MYD75230.1 Zn-dependent alcohol dehydrogenase [Gammaproteobacteria bacterium]MYJ51707.1 Zn-dependent alcohol dehydrogenase [Gammaproteobacteria bacterium]
MKAAVCREHGKPLTIEEVAIANPTGRQVKVKIGACAICHSDIHFAEGAWGGHLPAVYGHEAAGVVVEAGPEVERIAVGDRVIVTLIRSCGNCFYCDQGEPVMCGHAAAPDDTHVLQLEDGTEVAQGMKTAAFAEWVVVDDSQVARLPDDMPLDVASLLACGVITGVGAVINTAAVKPGSNVVVVGVGGVGLNAVQGARIAGAKTIIAVDIEDQKLDIAKRFGATHGLNANIEKLSRNIRALTDGHGADYAFVTVGSKQAIDSSYRFIRRGGEVVIVGMPAVGEKSEFLPLALAGSVQKIQGSFMGQTRLRVDIPWLLSLYGQGILKLDELVSNRYSLEQINEAIEDTLKGQSLRNVLIIDDTL